MGFRSCCRDCACWSVFTCAMLVLLLSLCLAVNDVVAANELQDHIDAVEGSSLAELGCSEVCRSWFREERGGLCCDQVGAGECVDKQLCKKEYLSVKYVSMESLQDDAFSEMLIVVCFLVISLGVVAFQYTKDRRYDMKDLEIQIEAVLENSLKIKPINEENEAVCGSQKLINRKSGAESYGEAQQFMNPERPTSLTEQL